MPRPTLRATLALGLVGVWMALLFAGHALGGSIHLLLPAAAVLYPWKSLTHPFGKEDRSAGAPPRQP